MKVRLALAQALVGALFLFAIGFSQTAYARTKCVAIKEDGTINPDCLPGGSLTPTAVPTSVPPPTARAEATAVATAPPAPSPVPPPSPSPGCGVVSATAQPATWLMDSVVAISQSVTAPIGRFELTGDVTADTRNLSECDLQVTAAISDIRKVTLPLSSAAISNGLSQRGSSLFDRTLNSADVGRLTKEVGIDAMSVVAVPSSDSFRKLGARADGIARFAVRASIVRAAAEHGLVSSADQRAFVEGRLERLFPKGSACRVAAESATDKAVTMWTTLVATPVNPIETGECTPCEDPFPSIPPCNESQGGSGPITLPPPAPRPTDPPAPPPPTPKPCGCAMQDGSACPEKNVTCKPEKEVSECVQDGPPSTDIATITDGYCDYDSCSLKKDTYPAARFITGGFCDTQTGDTCQGGTSHEYARVTVGCDQCKQKRADCTWYVTCARKTDLIEFNATFSCKKIKRKEAGQDGVKMGQGQCAPMPTQNGPLPGSNDPCNRWVCVNGYFVCNGTCDYTFYDSTKDCSIDYSRSQMPPGPPECASKSVKDYEREMGQPGPGPRPPGGPALF